MTKEFKYLLFCIETYKKARGLSGKETYALFEKYGFLDYILDLYEILHIQGTRYLLEELDEYRAYRESQA